MMNLDRKRKINELAYHIRKVAGLTTPLKLSHLNNFINNLGGKLVLEKMERFEDGKITRDKQNDNFIIALNSDNNQNEERKKFTLCHELGHLFIHMKYLDKDKWNQTIDYHDTVYARSGYSDEEYDAHEFAAALLMPENEYRKVVLENTQDRICKIKKVAQHFEVSVEAATNRGKWLGILKW